MSGTQGMNSAKITDARRSFISDHFKKNYQESSEYIKVSINKLFLEMPKGLSESILRTSIN